MYIMPTLKFISFHIKTLSLLFVKILNMLALHTKSKPYFVFDIVEEVYVKINTYINCLQRQLKTT